MSNFLDQQPNKSPTLLTDNMCPFEVKAPTLLGGMPSWMRTFMAAMQRAAKAQKALQQKAAAAAKAAKLFEKYTDYDYSGALIRNPNDDVGCHRVRNWKEAEDLCKNNNKCGGFTFGKGLRLHGNHKNSDNLRACLYEYSYESDWDGSRRKKLLPVPPNFRTVGIGVDYGRKLK